MDKGFMSEFGFIFVAYCSKEKSDEVCDFCLRQSNCYIAKENKTPSTSSEL